ncbi:MAG: hypothetical protein JNN04_01570 [Cyclobacteriaceae bacterium]|nr:hypothetical protein [Cyclobacteriaceae bacterium]
MARWSAIIWILAAIPLVAHSQVNRIKSASKAYGSSEKSGRGFFGSSLDFLLYAPRHEYKEVQTYREPDSTFNDRCALKFSVETLGDVGVKTGGGYIFWPRVRANFGIFSTDYRVNYMVEKEASGAKTTLRTNDWQMLHLNIFSTSLIDLRVGGGIMYEIFGDHYQYPEFTAGLGIHAPDLSRIFYLEYRNATDAGNSIRREWSATYQLMFFHLAQLHGYIGLGLTYQQYYGSIDILTLQAGLAFRIFRDPSNKY